MVHPVSHGRCKKIGAGDKTSPGENQDSERRLPMTYLAAYTSEPFERGCARKLNDVTILRDPQLICLGRVLSGYASHQGKKNRQLTFEQHGDPGRLCWWGAGIGIRNVLLIAAMGSARIRSPPPCKHRISGNLERSGRVHTSDDERE